MQGFSIQSAQQRLTDVLRPIRAMRWSYLPLLMVYFAYGALGLIDVSRDMWIKERLTLSAADLAGLGVWLSLPCRRMPLLRDRRPCAAAGCRAERRAALAEAISACGRLLPSRQATVPGF